MKDKKSTFSLRWKSLARFGRYKYVLLVIFAGLILLLWPDSSKTEQKAVQKSTPEESFSIDLLEEKLSNTLSKVDGAGNVQVMLTVQSGMKHVVAQDISLEQEEGAIQRETQTVIISTGSGQQEAVLLQQIYPKFQGALIIADGGNDPNIRLKLTQAVSALTGLGADKISICKGK